MVSIVADGNGRLYCSLLGVGVYRRDAGQTAWQACSAQPGSSANRNVYRLSWRDGGTADGTVYCVVTGKQDVNNAWAFGTSGVFASDDGGLTWADLTSSIDPAPTYVRGFDLTPDGCLVQLGH